jgi:hypothetical protein
VRIRDKDNTLRNCHEIALKSWVIDNILDGIKAGMAVRSTRWPQLRGNSPSIDVRNFFQRHAKPNPEKPLPLIHTMKKL